MDHSRILIVDDDKNARQALTQVLQRQAYIPNEASSAQEALNRLNSEDYDLVITDIRMERMDGIELLRSIKSKWPDIPVIIMTAFANIDTAVRSIHEGAYDYISKPYEIDDLRLTVRRALEQARILRENLTLKQNLADQDRDLPIVGMSPVMVEVYKRIARIAHTPTTVLIEGESGSGKELVARAIHSHSDRSVFPFVAVNCGSFTESLLESELFGHVKGAFTGAAYTKQGLFETANRGVVFLDEIADTSMNMQAKLLRVLEEREIMRVGSMDRHAIDVRIIAATNRPLSQLVKDGRFREDLFYRLNVVAITVPPLRDRMTDLPLLFDHFLKKHSRKMGKTIAVQNEALEMLLNYNWPGNVRELENMVERTVALNTSGILTPDDFADESITETLDGFSFPDKLVPLDDVQRRYVLHVVSRCGQNMSRASEVLGIDRRTLYRMLERYETETEPADS